MIVMGLITVKLVAVNLALNKIILLAYSISSSPNADVDVRKPYILAAENPYECGESLTLTCLFKNGTNFIAWKTAKDKNAIAFIAKNSFKLNQNYSEQFHFTFDLPQYVFNLTITNVTMEYDNSEFVCTDGYRYDSEVIKVRKRDPLLYEDSKYGVIKATSSCFDFKQDVKFKWIKANGNQHELEASPTINNRYTKKCSECGIGEQKQYIEMISAKRNENGCFLKFIAFYGNESAESNFTVGKYIIEEEGEEHTKAALIVVLVFIALIIAAIVYFISKPHIQAYGPVR